MWCVTAVVSLFYLDGGTVGYPAPPRLILPWIRPSVCLWVHACRLGIQRKIAQAQQIRFKIMNPCESRTPVWMSTCLQIRYSAENSTGPTDSVQNHESMMWIENSGVNEISHKTQNKKTGPTDSINNSWEFRGSSSPRAASVCCNVKYY